VAQHRKTAADYGQLSLFAEEVPEWLQPAEPPLDQEQLTSTSPAFKADDDDLSQFNAWLQQNRQSNHHDE
jgi:hypothetical protein